MFIKGKLKIGGKDREGRIVVSAHSDDNEFPCIPVAIMEHGVVPTKEEAEANAKELVRRWNSHDEIVNRCGEIGVERDIAIGEFATVKQQRDDLLAACKYSHTLLLRNIGQSTHAVALLEAAIASAQS